jgi:RimJ/RimL family protein N-acetyltransferase
MKKYEIHTKLDDGTPILIRPLRPDDKESIKEGFERISQHSRYLRYLSSGAKLTDEDLELLTCADPKKGLALGVCDLTYPVLYGIAVARYVMCDDEPDTAEIAIVIVDEYQRRGLGSILLKLIVELARDNHVRSLCGYVLPENRAMIHLLKQVNATFKSMGRSMFRIDIPLYFETAIRKAS